MIGEEIGPYRILRQLGCGAFGVVWLAEKRDLGGVEYCALKIPQNLNDLDSTTAILEAIRSEARNWKRVSGHPNVVSYYEANVFSGHIVIVSEYVSGGTLEEYLQAQGGQIPFETAIVLCSGILAGIEHLHQSGLLHRDVKPSNILLERTNAEMGMPGTPKLADFGIAKLQQSPHQSFCIKGTPMYMSPESLQGIYSEQSDLWAVAVIFYRMVIGSLPFASASVDEIISQAKSFGLATLPNTLPANATRFISKCFSPKPADRFPSAAQMAKAMKDLQVAEPPVVRSKPGLARRIVIFLSVFFVASAVIGLIAVKQKDSSPASFPNVPNAPDTQPESDPIVPPPLVRPPKRNPKPPNNEKYTQMEPDAAQKKKNNEADDKKPLAQKLGEQGENEFRKNRKDKE
jgi:serine/threonine protein kinase